MKHKPLKRLFSRFKDFIDFAVKLGKFIQFIIVLLASSIVLSLLAKLQFLSQKFTTNLGNSFGKNFESYDPQELGENILFSGILILLFDSIDHFVFSLRSYFLRLGFSKDLIQQEKELNKEISKKDEEIENLNVALEKEMVFRKNFEKIEECILQNIQKPVNYNSDLIKDFYKENVTAFPIRFSYLRKIGNKNLVVLYSDVEIKMNDKRGSSATIERHSYIMALDDKVDEYRYKVTFSKGTKVNDIFVFDHPPKKEDIISEDPLEIRIPLKLKRFEIQKVTIVLTLKNCFVDKNEYWKTGMLLYPSTYERVLIALRDSPKNVQFIPDGNIKGIIKTNIGYTNNKHTIESFLNYQEGLKKFEIKWENS